jgi:2-polyprenyl-6-methoxyphenol hydroxylase-like FAD-dependent oxidoreductase
MKSSPEKVTLIGGGLNGPLLAILLRHLGFAVEIYERRPDMRRVRMSAGRSINLALSTRGIYALQQTGIWERMRSIVIPMKGRMMHTISGELTFQPYGKNETEVINSISRAELNIALMDAAEEQGATIHFNQRCTGYDLKTGAIRLRDEDTGEDESRESGVVIGCDGSASTLRTEMLKLSRFNHGVRLVDPDTGREYARLEYPGQARADDICFTPDGNELVVSSGESDAIQVWDLRIIREQLAEINLDWDLPVYPQAVRHHDRVPLRAEVDVGPEFALARFEALVRAGRYDEVVHLADVAAGLPPAGWKESHQAVKLLERGLRAVHDDARLPEVQRRTRCHNLLERTRAHALEALKRGAPAVAGVLEAETLPVLDWQGCQPIVQYIFDYDWGSKWSNGMQLMGNEMKKDGFVEVEVAATREGRYRLLVQFCRSYDYGTVEIQLDGRKIGKPFDGYATAVVLAGEQEIAVAELSRGKHRLRFTAVDKNEKSRGYQLGMDYLKLQPVGK